MAETRVPVLGQEYDPLRLQGDPYAFYARARREDPVFHSPRLGAWVVTRFRDVQRVLADPETFSLAAVLRSLEELTPEATAEIEASTPPLPADAGNPGDEARLRARKPIQQAFTQARVNALRPHLEEQVAELVEEFAAGGPGDLQSRLARRLPIRGKARVLGLAAQDVDAVVEGSYSLTVLMSAAARLSPEEQVANARRVAAYQRLLDRYAQQRRAEPRDDLFSAVVAAVAEGEGPLTARERRTVVESLVGLIGAGQSTTTAMVSTAVWHLLHHRDQWDLLCEQPDLAARAVEEVARYDMPLQGLFRQVTRPVELGGKSLAAGDRLMVLYASANRDEAQYERPDTLDITREPRRHFAFGHGPRACVGSHLARALLQSTLRQLSARLPGLRLDGEDALEFLPGMHRIVRRLRVTW
ncbi:cytochrome P450 [Streptomyces sp. enrichment culture]|uniref:cytochrome P450 n=1 Tax=Streptomyces sp. enrichment culture TaxID=1795815 RepID=UPI003F55420D